MHALHLYSCPSRFLTYQPIIDSLRYQERQRKEHTKKFFTDADLKLEETRKSVVKTMADREGRVDEHVRRVIRDVDGESERVKKERADGAEDAR